MDETNKINGIEEQTEEIREKTEEEVKEEAKEEVQAETLQSEDLSAEEIPAEEVPAEATGTKKPAKKKRKALRIVMIAILLALLAVVVYFAALVISVKNSDSPVGYWVIKESAAGGVTMTEEDAKAIGLNEIGSVRLDKSGTCKVVILDEEYDGTWTSADDGTVTISYGEEQTLSATIDEEGVMTAHDDSQMEYTLEK